MKYSARGYIGALSTCLALLTVGLSAIPLGSAFAPTVRTAPGLSAQGDPFPRAQELATSLGQERLNLEASRGLLHLVHQRGNHDDLLWVAEAAGLASRHQAATLGLAWNEPVPLRGYTNSSQAILALVEREGVDLTSAQRDVIYTVDALPEPLGGELVRFLDAFLALDAAARVAYAHADLGPALRAETEVLRSNLIATGAPVGLVFTGPRPGEARRDAGVDLSLVFPTRYQFLDAALAVRNAVEFVGAALGSTVALDLCPAVALDLVGVDSTYRNDCALVLDLGGSDTYLNNAGGNGLHTLGEPCFLDHPWVAAALVDLGDGADMYGNPEAPRSCGVNGGGRFGVGFLFDGGGDDTYTGGGIGTNGGGGGGAGLLLDLGGNDTYTATFFGTNGGAASGVGLLMDANGDDKYSAGDGGTNGGSYLGGMGFLLDAGGNDHYRATVAGTNGGGYGAGVYRGTGFLLDAGGNDDYAARDRGTNGGGRGAVGFLLDADGTDTYRAIGLQNVGAWGSGVNGGAVPDPITGSAVQAGLLLDLRGIGDTYCEDSAGPGDLCEGLISGTDRSVVPKGTVGGQLDSDDSPL